MEIEVLNNPDAVACKAAALIAADARAAVASRGRFVLAVSGGKTPWLMLRFLADENMPWDRVHLVQVDERVAPAGHSDRNLTHLRESLLARVSLRDEQVHTMPVESTDLTAAAASYSQAIAEIAGLPAVVDLVHLGLGRDGHTASLVPGDPALDISDTDVGLTGVYQGKRRMTLTYPNINRSRRILWLVTGGDKSGPLRLLLDADRSIPAGRVRQSASLIIADRDAAPD